MGIISRTADDNPLLQHHLLKLTATRTGTEWTAIAHIITGVIGSGVLSLAWSMAQLGWIAGPICMLFFAVVTLISTFLICNCYRYPDPKHGHIKNKSYNDAIQMYLGEKHAWVCGIMMLINFYGSGVAYVITSALCMRAIPKSNCYHKYRHDNTCEFGTTGYLWLFGIIQIVISQIPDFHRMDWLSIVAATMSFTYSFIGLGLGAAKVIGNKEIKGTIYGVSMSHGSKKVWQVSQAFGDIAFAYPYSMIVLNIQSKTMKKASMISIGITTFFYLSVGGSGYAAYGDQTPGSLLTGLGFFEPYWLIDFANACVVLHLVGGYQVYSQPVFALADKWFVEKFPANAFVNRDYAMKLPLLPILNLNMGRLCFRTAYVASTTAIAIAFPYFNEVLGVLGAFVFWPVAVYFPVEMGLKQKNIVAWTSKWILLRSFSVLCFVLSLFALIGSVGGLVSKKFS